MTEGTIGFIIGIIIVIVFAVAYYIIDKKEKNQYK